MLTHNHSSPVAHLFLTAVRHFHCKIIQELRVKQQDQVCVHIQTWYCVPFSEVYANFELLARDSSVLHFAGVMLHLSSFVAVFILWYL